MILRTSDLEDVMRGRESPPRETAAIDRTSGDAPRYEPGAAEAVPFDTCQTWLPQL